MVKKHCVRCRTDIDDVMGFWKCPLCGGDLEKGFLCRKGAVVCTL
jgi:PHP family Zn ribbon phosphoesterase